MGPQQLQIRPRPQVSGRTLAWGGSELLDCLFELLWGSWRNALRSGVPVLYCVGGHAVH